MPVTQKLTNNPLPIFFISIEPSPTNFDIIKLNSLCYIKIKVEIPHPKKVIIYAIPLSDLMATLIAIAITLLDVFAVVSTINQQHIPRIASPRLNALFVVEITWLTFGVVNPTWILKRLLPNPSKNILNKSSPPRQPLEVNAYERLHQAYTQHST
jgi:hypothetical protein